MRRARALGALFGLALAATSAYPAGEGYISGTVRDEAFGPAASRRLRVRLQLQRRPGRGGHTNAPGSTRPRVGGRIVLRATSTWLSRDAYFEELYHEVACPFDSATGPERHAHPCDRRRDHDRDRFSLTPEARSAHRDGRGDGPATPPTSTSAVHTHWLAVTSGRTDSSGVYTSYAQLPSGSFYARDVEQPGIFRRRCTPTSRAPPGACSVTSGTPSR